MKLIRKLLYPFGMIYGLILSIRNILFDINFFRGRTTLINSIGVGNLSVGGTGKSIVVDYLISKFQLSQSLVVLSRGYGRKSKGFIMANSLSDAEEIGDEPFQYFKKYSNIRVAVGENRVKSVNEILKIDSNLSLLILDDIMQHRWIIPDHLILTTTFSNPFFKDFPMPYGSLREFSCGQKRSHTIIVTKCPTNLTEREISEFTKKCRLTVKQKIFFTKINYSDSIINLSKKIQIESLVDQKIILVTGIANPVPLVNFLISKNINLNHLQFRDHFNFNSKSINKIKKKAGKLLILTTEKDYGRLYPKLNTNKLFYIPITLKFINNSDENEFNKRINPLKNR